MECFQSFTPRRCSSTVSINTDGAILGDGTSSDPARFDFSAMTGDEILELATALASNAEAMQILAAALVSADAGNVLDVGDDGLLIITV